MAAKAASLPDHAPNRQASGVERHPTPGSAPASGIKGSNGEIFAGFYKNFQSLSADEKQAIFQERKRLNIKTTRGRGANPKKGKTSAIQSNKKAMSKMTRKIASLETKLKNVGNAKKASSNDEDSDVQDNAGDQFGGCKKEKHKRANPQA
jgi:hypothetical protein